MLTVLVLIACMTGPGIFAVSYVNLPSTERLPIVVAISATATFMVAWTCFLLELPAWTAIVWCGGCAIATLAGWQTWHRLLQRPSAQFCLCGTLLTALVVLLLQSSIFAYHGGSWTGDWFEHYQRAEFFLDRDNPLEARFLPPVNYLLPARPPLFNVIAAHIMTVTGRDFANYQIIAGVLNSLLCLPLLALAIRFLRVAGVRRLPGLTAVNAALILLPSFMQNATFPWTKSLTSFFVLTALLQVSHIAESDRGGFRRGGMVGMLLAAAVLTHYSAMVYVVVIGGWLFWWAFIVRPLQRWGIIGCGLLCGLPLVSLWFSYVGTVFGWDAIVGTTSAYADAAGLGWQENLNKILLNTYDTVVPHYLRSRPVVVSTLMQQPSWLGRLRDYWFLPLQVNFPGAVGTVAPVTLIGIGIHRVSHWHRQQCQRLSGFFWIWVFAAGLVLGVAVHGGRDAVGLAHICLQPLILVAAAAMISWLPRLPRVVQLVGLAGIAFDALVGIGLQFWLQHLPLKITKTIGPDGVCWMNNLGLSIVATDSVFAKKMLQLVFISDTITMRALPLWAAAIAGCLAFGGLLWALSRDSVRSAHAEK